MSQMRRGLSKMRRSTAVLAIIAITLVVWMWAGSYSPFPGYGVVGSLLTLVMVLLVIWRLFESLWSRRQQANEHDSPSRWKSKWIKLLILAPVILAFLIELGDLSGRKQPIFVQATQLLNESSQARSVLGEPMRVGWPIALSSQESSESGYMHLTIPVSGSLHHGVLYASGIKIAGGWMLEEVDLKVKDAASSQISLRRP
jgi:hypothetical protein